MAVGHNSWARVGGTGALGIGRLWDHHQPLGQVRVWNGVPSLLPHPNTSPLPGSLPFHAYFILSSRYSALNNS